MNLNDFKNENMSALLSKILELTKADTLVWKSEYPIDLSDPNNQTYYFTLTVSEVDYTIYFERNYDPVCVGLVTMFYWFNVDGTKERIMLDYTDTNVIDLTTEIGNQQYRFKILDQVENIDELNTMINEIFP